MLSIFSYWQTENLGDAIQTIALSRLLNSQYSFRDRDTGAGAASSDVHLCNGYLDGRWTPAPAARTAFLGVHAQDAIVASTLSTLAERDEVVGVRDPYTLALLQEQGIECAMIGCATLTLPRYDGPRSGEVHIDSGEEEQLTHSIPPTMPWKAQWWHATERLLLLQRAELVITRRLHVALPCLAFGTPVMMPAETLQCVAEPARLSILDAIGFQFGVPQSIDVTEFAVRYTSFLHDCLPAGYI